MQTVCRELCIGLRLPGHPGWAAGELLAGPPCRSRGRTSQREPSGAQRVCRAYASKQELSIYVLLLDFML